jgi:MerR family mercuric resistance operon transcriptional regulator
VRGSAGLQVSARAKLAEIEERIERLQAVAAALRAADEAGCDDLVECAGEAACPIPFT